MLSTKVVERLKNNLVKYSWSRTGRQLLKSQSTAGLAQQNVSVLCTETCMVRSLMVQYYMKIVLSLLCMVPI